MTIFYEIKLATQALAKPHDHKAFDLSGLIGELMESFAAAYRRIRCIYYCIIALEEEREKDDDRAFVHEVVTKMAEAVPFLL